LPSWSIQHVGYKQRTTRMVARTERLTWSGHPRPGAQSSHSSPGCSFPPSRTDGSAFSA
jgi:hypothetical protein